MIKWNIRNIKFINFEGIKMFHVSIPFLIINTC